MTLLKVCWKTSAEKVGEDKTREIFGKIQVRTIIPPPPQPEPPSPVWRKESGEKRRRVTIDNTGWVDLPRGLRTSSG